MSSSALPATTVRLAERSDAAALAALAAATFPLACPPGIDPADIASHISSHLSSGFFATTMTRADAVIQVAEVDAALVGYVLVYLGIPDGARLPDCIGPETTAELSKCYVLPDWQGTGLARRLVEVALASAKRSGANGIWLGVNRHNRRAQGFYTKMGFCVVGRRHYQVGRGTHSDLVMEQSLR